MNKCYEIVNISNGDEYGIWLNRADAEEMAFAISEELSYECFLWYWLKWEDDMEVALRHARYTMYQVYIKEHNLFNY